MGTLTEVLNSALDGRATTAGAAWNAVYDEVHHMAAAAVARESPRTQLQPTLLVHEVFLRLNRHHPDRWENRRHFFGAVARSMQQYLVDQARKRGAKRRGGDRRKISLSMMIGELANWETASTTDVQGLVDAMHQLEQDSPRAAEIAQLRYILGLTVTQVAGITGISDRTVKKDWAYARAWLRRHLDCMD